MYQNTRLTGLIGISLLSVHCCVVNNTDYPDCCFLTYSHPSASILSFACVFQFRLVGQLAHKARRSISICMCLASATFYGATVVKLLFFGIDDIGRPCPSSNRRRCFFWSRIEKQANFFSKILACTFEIYQKYKKTKFVATKQS